MFRAENPNAKKPVVFFSEDSHYSVLKLCSVLDLPTFHDLGIEYLQIIQPPLYLRFHKRISYREPTGRNYRLAQDSSLRSFGNWGGRHRQAANLG